MSCKSQSSRHCEFAVVVLQYSRNSETVIDLLALSGFWKVTAKKDVPEEIICKPDENDKFAVGISMMLEGQ